LESNGVSIAASISPLIAMLFCSQWVANETLHTSGEFKESGQFSQPFEHFWSTIQEKLDTKTKMWSSSDNEGVSAKVLYCEFAALLEQVD
jgi:hypothetical protein